MRTWPHDFPSVDSTGRQAELPAVRLPLGATMLAAVISLGCWVTLAHGLGLI